MDVLHGQLRGRQDACVRVQTGDVSPQLLRAARASRSAAVDSETSGLDPKRNRLCTVQVFVPGFGAEVVQVRGSQAENLKALFGDERVCKIFHFATFDLSFLQENLGIAGVNVVCTKVAAKLLFPNQPESQKLASLVQTYLGVTLDKTQRMSDWSAETLSDAQVAYAIGDVLYLPELFKLMHKDLIGHGLEPLARSCWLHLPTRVSLELQGFGDVFSY